MRTLLVACGLALSLLGAPWPAAAQDSRVGLAWYLPSWDQLPFTTIQHGEVEYLGARSQSQTSYLSNPQAKLKATILLSPTREHSSGILRRWKALATSEPDSRSMFKAVGGGDEGYFSGAMGNSKTMVRIGRLIADVWLTSPRGTLSATRADRITQAALVPMLARMTERPEGN